ncbi:MAG: hypothetical protein ABIJ22_04965 [Patescibacteria group bacterium]
MNKIAAIIKTGREVFAAQDLVVIWGYCDERKLYELIKYYVRREEIFVLARGLYAIKQYTEQELRGDPQLLMKIANKLVPNSYVSLFTVLRQQGVISQYYDEVYCVASRSVIRRVMGVEFIYKQVKEEVLLNELGIVSQSGVRVASLERAVADMWYVYPKLNLENLERVNKKELRRIVKIYGKKVMQAKLTEI